MILRDCGALLTVARVDPADVPVVPTIHDVHAPMSFVPEHQHPLPGKLHLHHGLADGDRRNLRLHLGDDHGLERFGLDVVGILGPGEDIRGRSTEFNRARTVRVVVADAPFVAAKLLVQLLTAALERGIDL